MQEDPVQDEPVQEDPVQEGFHGWPDDAPAVLRELAEDNSRAFWAAHGRRHARCVRAPMCALAAALEPEFGTLRVFRPQVNRRFRPAAPPYRTDTGAVTVTAGGCVLGVVLSAAALSVSAGRWRFDPGQLRRYRAAVDGGPGEELERVLAGLGGFAADEVAPLNRGPRGHRADHPRIGLLRRRGLQVTRAWAVGPWLGTTEPLDRVPEAWRAAAPLARWLDEHVGSPDPVPPRPRPAAPPPAVDLTAAEGGGVEGGVAEGGVADAPGPGGPGGRPSLVRG